MQAASIPRQSRRKNPSRKPPPPTTNSAAAARRPSGSGLSACHRPTASTSTSSPARFAPTWLYSQGLFAVIAPRSEMSSRALL